MRHLPRAGRGRSTRRGVSGLSGRVGQGPGARGVGRRGSGGVPGRAACANPRGVGVGVTRGRVRVSVLPAGPSVHPGAAEGGAGARSVHARSFLLFFATELAPLVNSTHWGCECS